MANTHVPVNLHAVEVASNRVTVAWDHPSPPVEKLFQYRVRISLSATNPIPGPAHAVVAQRQYVVSGYSSNVYITVSSVNRETGEESAQSSSFFVSIDHTASGIGGAIAKSDSDVPKFLRVDENGNLILTATIDTTGLATSEKQDHLISLLGDIRAAAGLNPFNEFWEDLAVPQSVMTQVHTITVPPGPGPAFFMTGLYVTGRYPAILELKRDALLVWRGRTNNVDPDKQVLFSGGPVTASPGQTLTLSLKHDYPANLEFAGNLFGFKA